MPSKRRGGVVRESCISLPRAILRSLSKLESRHLPADAAFSKLSPDVSMRFRVQITRQLNCSACCCLPKGRIRLAPPKSGSGSFIFSSPLASDSNQTHVEQSGSLPLPNFFHSFASTCRPRKCWVYRASLESPSIALETTTTSKPETVTARHRRGSCLIATLDSSLGPPGMARIPKLHGGRVRPVIGSECPQLAWTPDQDRGQNSAKYRHGQTRKERHSFHAQCW